MKKIISTFLAAAICLSGMTVLGKCRAEAAGNAVPSDPAKLIEDIPTVQAFTDEAVDVNDINAIVLAGINAPSAMNGQPWHFSVVTSKEVLDEMAGGTSFGDMAGGMPSFDFGSPQEMPEGMDMNGFPGGGFEMPEGMGVPEGMPGNMPGQPADFSGAPGMGAPVSTGAKAAIGDAPLVIVVSCKAGSDLDAGLATQNMSAEAQLLGYGTKIISSPKMTLNQDSYKELLGIPEDMSVVCVLLVGNTDTAEYDVLSGATTRNAVDETVTFVR